MAVRLVIDADVNGQAQVDRLNNSVRNIENNTGRVSRGLRGLQRLVGTAFAVGSVVIFANQIAKAADGVTNINNLLKAAGISNENLAETSADVLRVANETRSSYEAIGGLYARVLRSSRELGISQQEALDITQAFAQSLQLSGASTQEAEAAALQFGQALASGRLQGDELRSILENNSFFAQALAAELGVGVGELRKLGAEGALTSELLAEIALKLAPQMNEQFEQLEPTFGQAFQVFGNGVQQALAGAGNLLNDYTGIKDIVIEAGESLSAIFGPEGTGLDFSGFSLGELLDNFDLAADQFADNIGKRIMEINWVEVFGALAKGINDAIIATLRVAWTVSSTIGRILLDFFGDIAQDFGETISGAVADAFEGAIEAVKGAINSVIAALENAINAATEFTRSGFGSGGIPDIPLISLPKFNQGGRVSGEGTATSDSILARLSNGEFVVNARSTSRYLPLLEAINQGGIPGFQAGGLVERLSALGFSGIDISGLSESEVEKLTKQVENLEMAIESNSGTQESFQAILERTISEIKGEGSEDGLFETAIGRAQASFASALADGFRSGDFSNVVDSVLNTFTNSVIDSFSSSIADAIFSSIDFSSFFGGQTGSDILGGIGSFFGGFFNDGGVVPGRPGQAVPIVAHAGEVVLNRDQQERLLNGGTGGVTVNLNVTGDVSMETRRNVLEMLPEIADSTQAIFAERQIIGER